MKNGTICIFAAAACLLTLSARAGELEFSGNFDLGVRAISRNGDEAKFEEYRDMGSGLFSDAAIRAFVDDHYMDFSAENVGRNDQSYLLETGRYGQYKLSAFYDEIPHNFTHGAKTFYDGVGAADLVDSGNAGNPDLWHGFDYYKDRKTAGMKGEVSFDTPFYIEFGARRQESEGIYPFAGSSPTTEFPAPVDWEESNVYFGTGYQGKSVVFSLRADFSDFDNDKETLGWSDNVSSLAPDSDFYKLSGKFVWRGDFMASVLSLRASHSKKENTLDLWSIDPSASARYFNGEVSYTRLDAAYDFDPVERLDLKISAKYHESDNDSDVLSFGTSTTKPFDREMKSAGFDGTWDLPARTYIDAGYSYTDTERDGRDDNDKTEDDLAFVQVRNRYWSRVELRAKYEYLDREGNYIGTSDDGVRLYDVADQKRNKVELESAIFLIDNLSCGLEYAWWDSDYDDSVYGMTDLSHQQVYASVNFGDPAVFLATTYAGFEYDETQLKTSRDWSEKQKFDTFAYGIALEMPAMGDRLLFTLSWDHSLVDGEADFKSSASDPDDPDDVDDYSIQEFEAKCKYRIDDNWSVTAGYVFEKFDLDDDQWDGYEYLPDGAVLSGAYADQDYEANIGFLTASYRF